MYSTFTSAACLAKALFWPAKPKFRLTLLGLGQYCSCSLSEDYYTMYASWLVAAL